DAKGAKISDQELAAFRGSLSQRKRLREAVIADYQRNGATYGGWSKNKGGDRVFQPGPKVDDEALPGFRFDREPRLQLHDLGIPFALSFEGVALPDGALQRLTKLKLLTTLDLNGTPVSDAALKHLAGHEKLSVLYLAATKVTDQGLKDLAGLANLEELDLSLTQVTDAGLRELAGLKKLTSLQLHSTGVTDVGLKELAGLKGLTRLDLGKTRVTDAGLAQLRRSLPNCEIHR